MPARISLLTIGIGLAVLLGIAIYHTLGKFEGGPVLVPEEAVPIWAKPGMSFGNKIFEYLFPLFIPVGSMIKCPTTPPYDSACMSKGRKAVSFSSEASWKAIVESTHTETAIQIKRNTGSSPLEVVLLHKRNMTGSLCDSPLILWMHGGGFTTGQARDAYMLLFVNELVEHSSVAKSVVFASVEYRLSPEYSYPAAQEDCFLAFEYLLTEYTCDDSSPERRFGGSGVHVAGASAGGTLAATTTLRALKAGLRIDSVFLESPFFMSPSSDDDAVSPLHNSHSHRYNAYTRCPPIHWLDWCVCAVAGKEQKDAATITDKEFSGGVTFVTEWKTHAGNQQLPPMVLVTGKFDGLHDAGVDFGRVYEEAGGSVQYVDPLASHAFSFLSDRKSFQEGAAKWANLIQSAANKQ